MLTEKRLLSVVLGLGIIGTASSFGQAGPSHASTNGPSTRARAWWRDPAPVERPYQIDSKRLPLISVKTNKFVDPSGTPLMFRGVSISDPDKVEMQGHWDKAHFEKVKELGANVVRIPVHPIAWRERTPHEYIKLLDQAVGWCTELNMYVLLDWHSIGNLETGVFQNPMYDTSKQETYNFWRAMARHYAGHNTVAFWELFNEPTTYREQLGPVRWDAWKNTVEEQITLIRAYNPQAVILVAGFDWAYDLTPIIVSPIAAPGIGYTVHPYSNKRSQPWEPKWEENFGFAAAKYPVFATEFGGFDEDYGPRIIKFLEDRGISWAAWCFDPDWGPTLIKNWNYDLTRSGQFIKGAMKGENNLSQRGHPEPKQQNKS